MADLYCLYRRAALKIMSRSSKMLSSLTLLPIMYLGKFGQNPSTGSEDNARKPYVGHFKVPCDLENWVKVTKF